MYASNFYIITGGPGVGKTTLLQELQKAGYPVVREAAREIIRTQVAAGGEGLPWENRDLYTQLMADASIADYLDIQEHEGQTPVFFDRGLPDAVCYAEMIGSPLAQTLWPALSEYRYHPTVFLLPPWKEIYDTDNERKQTWAEAEATYGYMKELYIRAGYIPVEVPKADVQTRCRFVSDHIRP